MTEPKPNRPLVLKTVFLPGGADRLGFALYDAETDQLIGDQTGLVIEQDLTASTVTVTFRLGNNVKVGEG